MLDAVYAAMNGTVEVLFANQRVRRTAMLACFCLPFGILFLNPSWVREGYLLTAPLLFLGSGLVIIDMHLWEQRRDDARARRAAEAAEQQAGD